LAVAAAASATHIWMLAASSTEVIAPRSSGYLAIKRRMGELVRVCHKIAPMDIKIAPMDMLQRLK